jgi:two-component system OmpR family sensor kinase
MSLRARYVLATAAITLGTLGVAFAAVSNSVNTSQERQLDLELWREAWEESAEVSAKGGDELAISARPGPGGNDFGPLTKYAALYGPSGEVLAQTPSWGGEPPPLESLEPTGSPGFDLWSKHEHLRGIHVVIPAHPGVTMLLATPRSDLDHDERFLMRAMATVFAIAALWSVVLAIVVVWRMTRAYRHIATVARRVAAGDLEARVDMRRGDQELVQLARDIDEMIARLGLLIGLQQRFIANAAHELRSPLTTLYGELAHALRRSREPEEYAQAISEALAAAQRLRRLTDELLEVARVGAAGAVHEPVEVAEVCREAIALVRGEAASRRVTLEWSGSDARVQGRTGDLVRLIRNLLENALHHAPDGGRVELRCAEADGRVTLTVNDDGPGIAEAERDRIFEAFYRGARERAANDSTGLGLTIVKEIARAHGGEVRLTRGALPGACFVIDLPGCMDSTTSEVVAPTPG